MIGVHLFVQNLAYCFYDSLTSTPLLHQWFHAANNSLSIIQFIARHKWNSKDSAATDDAIGSGDAASASPKTESPFYGCHTFPLKHGRRFFPPQNVCYKCNITELKETDGEGKISRGFADQCYHSSQCQRRPPPTPPKSDYFYKYTLTVLLTLNLKSSFKVKAKTLKCANGSETCRNELSSYLFTPALLSITVIIRIYSNIEKMRDAFLPIFQFGRGNYGHDECLNSPSPPPPISPNLFWQLRYCLPGNFLHNNCYCEPPAPPGFNKDS